MKNLISKVEATELRGIADRINELINEINSLHREAREIVGFEECNVAFYEETEPWFTSDENLREGYVEWCEKARSGWTKW